MHVIVVTISRESTNGIWVRFHVSQRIPISVTFTREATRTHFAWQLGAEPTGKLAPFESLTGDQTLVEYSQTEEQPAAIP